ncbi:MAG: hypothetical protein WD768_13680 [Phycisphaeraceae bacterium]
MLILWGVVRMMSERSRLGLLATTAVLLIPHSALAHVKWFSEFSYGDEPLPIADALTPVFWLLAFVSLATVSLLVTLERLLSHQKWAVNVERRLAAYKPHSLLVMRIGIFAVLLMSWQARVLLVPELNEWTPAVGWAQFVIALMLLIPRLVPIAGAGIICLYLWAIMQFGFFPMLDYLLWPGVGYYLLVANARSERLRATGLPVVYATLGFCLMWLAAEKIIYPQWSLYLLEGHPQLTFGMDHRVFLLCCAFIEFGLGYLLVMGLLGRVLALTITITVISTSTVFGRTELMGHTMIHTALIVVLIEGPGGHFESPIHWIRRFMPRLAVAGVGFALALAAVLLPYAYGAQWMYQRVDRTVHANEHDGHAQAVEVADAATAPTLTLRIHRDPHSGWNLELITTQFSFAPQSAGGSHIPGEGHAHLMVDGKKVARLYGHWFHLPPLAPGKHEVTVSLHANTHGPLLVAGKVIAATVEVEESHD